LGKHHDAAVSQGHLLYGTDDPSYAAEYPMSDNDAPLERADVVCFVVEPMAGESGFDEGGLLDRVEIFSDRRQPIPRGVAPRETARDMMI